MAVLHTVGKNIVGMLDSALAYRHLRDAILQCPGLYGIVQIHLVDHSADPPERAISVEVLADVETKETRPGMSGTQMIDGTCNYCSHTFALTGSKLYCICSRNRPGSLPPNRKTYFVC